MSKTMRVFVPLTKIDAANRLVFGVIADETKDFTGERLDYVSSKPNFEKWSGDIAKSTDGKSLGNVRVMHTPKAAGKVTDLVFDDVAKTIEACAKIVDDDEWKKVEEGVYTGFSIGGRYARKWKDGDAQRYTADPYEVSLVDVPCNPSATFSKGKDDAGAEVLQKFTPWEPSAADIAKRATELTQAGTNWTMFIESARADLIAKRAGSDIEIVDEHPLKDADPLNKDKSAGTDGDVKDKKDQSDDTASQGAADQSDQTSTDDKKKKKDADAKVDGMAGDGDKPADAAKSKEIAQVWQATDGKTFAKKADCVTYQADLDKPAQPENPLLKAIGDVRKDLTPEAKPEPDKLAKTIGDHTAQIGTLEQTGKLLKFLDGKLKPEHQLLRKSMWDVGSFANALCSLASVQQCAAMEADYEKDGSKVPTKLRDAIADLTMIFVEMAAEEAAEMLATLPGDMITTDPTDDPEVGVAVANAMKFLAQGGAESKLAKAGARHSKADLDKLQAIHDHSVGMGATCASDDAEKLKKSVDAAIVERDQFKKIIDDALPAIEELRKEIAVIKAQPNPPAPRLSVMEKVIGGSQASGGDDGQALDARIGDILKNKTPAEISDMMIRLSQQNPIKKL